MGVFAQLPDLPNLFSGFAKTTHANKQHYQPAQFISPLVFSVSLLRYDWDKDYKTGGFARLHVWEGYSTGKLADEQIYFKSCLHKKGAENDLSRDWSFPRCSAVSLLQAWGKGWGSGFEYWQPWWIDLDSAFLLWRLHACKLMFEERKGNIHWNSLSSVMD